MEQILATQQNIREPEMERMLAELRDRRDAVQARQAQANVEEEETEESQHQLPQDSDEEREARLGIPAGSPPSVSPDELINIPGDGTVSPTPIVPTNTQTEAEDEQAHLQHWLAGAGIQGLKSHLSEPPNDNNKGNHNQDPWFSPQGNHLLNEYAEKLSRLRNPRTREFILKYALPQGTNASVKTKVEEMLRRGGWTGR